MRKDNLINREEFKIHQNFNINIDYISEIFKELVPISDKKSFYIKSVIKRIQKCDELYLKELDEELDKVYNMLDTQDISLKDISKLLKLSTRLTSEVHNLCIENLKNICS